MATDEVSVRVEQRGGCAWVTLDRPPLNLLTAGLIDELRSAVAALSQDESVRVAVISGQGRLMTGGMQLQELRDLNETTARAFIAELAAAIDAVYRAPFPTIAMIHGACLGAGFELVMACDLRVATPDAQLGLPEVRVGIPSVIHAALLPPLVGPGRAAELLLTGEPIDGQRALEWGLVNRLAPGDALRATTEALIDAILACGPRAIRLQKELLVGWRNIPLEAAIAASVEAFARAYATDEPRRAMEAFLARRSL